MFRRDFVEKHSQHIISEDVIFNSLNIATDSKGWLLARDKMKIRCTLIMHKLKKSINFRHVFFSSVGISYLLSFFCGIKNQIIEPVVNIMAAYFAAFYKIKLSLNVEKPQ
jgi:hypothetical protein